MCECHKINKLSALCLAKNGNNKIFGGSGVLGALFASTLVRDGVQCTVHCVHSLYVYILCATATGTAHLFCHLWFFTFHCFMNAFAIAVCRNS